jgi:hypothetical protein
MLRYVGGGFLPGVPARNLTDEEARVHGEAVLLASGYYVHAETLADERQAGKVAHGGRSNKAVVPAAEDKAGEEGDA